MIITSNQNQKILYYESLKLAKNQSIENKYLIEGEHLINEAIKKQKLKTLIIVSDQEVNYDFSGEIILISINVAKKLSDLKNPSSVFGVCDIKNNEKNISKNILILDDIQDPGNLGTIIRSACAFNFSSIICSKECVSFYNPKTLRSAQGNHFNLKLISANLEEYLSIIKSNYFILGTFLNKPSNFDINEKQNKNIALILGNEGRGIKENLLKYCDSNYKLKISQNVESLNVSIAASIIMEKIDNKTSDIE